MKKVVYFKFLNKIDDRELPLGFVVEIKAQHVMTKENSIIHLWFLRV